MTCLSWKQWSEINLGQRFLYANVTASDSDNSVGLRHSDNILLFKIRKTVIFFPSEAKTGYFWHRIIHCFCPEIGNIPSPRDRRLSHWRPLLSQILALNQPSFKRGLSLVIWPRTRLGSAKGQHYWPHIHAFQSQRRRVDIRERATLRNHRVFGPLWPISEIARDVTSVEHQKSRSKHLAVTSK